MTAVDVLRLAWARGRRMIATTETPEPFPLADLEARAPELFAHRVIAWDLRDGYAGQIETVGGGRVWVAP